MKRERGLGLIMAEVSGPILIFCAPELRASALIFMFCASRLVFGVTLGVGSVFMLSAPIHVYGGPEGDGSHFHVLRAGTSFWRYRGRRVLFSCFALRDTFSTVRRASGPVFLFCTPRLNGQ
jgi:hypothetical protein